ncbi:MAG: aldehyde ferredoxin oxidoreductase family protein [Chloroflexi bacterium]|nr:aldehyde ferredoxin oxidoreductase family protein [Chloroflexota bacterium]
MGLTGWIGKIGEVNLSTGNISSLQLDETLCGRYLGGAGLAARLLYDRLPPGTDPLSPNNIVAVMTGPVTGTPFPGVGRVSFCSRSPLTGVWGESSMGGYFGQALKAAGYDGLLIYGASEKPVYLKVTNDGITLHDASPLWGLDTYETERVLKKTHGQRSQIASIGPAGENLVHISGIHHRGSDTAARCGLGAVLGAKRLKALIAEGDGEVAVADPGSLAELRGALISSYKNDAWVHTLRTGGTAWGMGLALDLNDVPVKNWNVEAIEWREQGEKISGQAMENAGLVVGRTSCYRCPIACRRIVQVDESAWQVSKSAGPEYETVGSLGAMLMIDDPRVLCKANELCNRYGIDTISCGGTVAWAIEAYERGILSKEDTDGLELRWGDGQVLLELIERIAYRRGIGNILSYGSRAAAKQVGGGSEVFAIQVKGLELAMHHPRAMRGLEISYATGARGASHNEGGTVHDEVSLKERAALIARSVDRALINASAVFCHFTVGPLSDKRVAEVLTAVTGHNYVQDDIYQIGSRIWHLRRAFNMRHCGIGSEADTLPPRVVAQLPADTPFDDLLAAYYHARGLDIRGVPIRRTLENLGLKDVADDLRI